MKKNNFIIITSPRCGSTLLTKALSMHPNLKVAEELLNPGHHAPGFIKWREKQLKKLYKTEEKNIKDGNKINQKYDLSLLLEQFYLKNNGFKLLYHQLNSESEVWNFIKFYPNMKIIFLNRNLIESILSFKLSWDSGIWQLKDNKNKIKDKPIELSLSYINKFYIEQGIKDKEKIKNKFKKNEFLDIEYKDLSLNWEKTLNKIQNFIEVKPIKLPKLLKKRTKKSPIKLISNYESLAGQLKNTKFGKYFNIKIML